MASIVKIHQASQAAPSQSDRPHEPLTKSPDAPPIRRAASARIIKTLPAGGELSSGGDGKTRASRGVAGKIAGATIGKNAAGNTGLVEFNFADLAEQGREQIERCRQQAEALMQEARGQAEQLKRDAQTQGHSKGKQIAESEIEQRIKREAETKAKAQVASLHQAVVQMKQQYDAWMQQYADVLTGTALAVAERLTRAEIVLPNFDDGADDKEGGPAKKSSAAIEDADPQEHLIVRWAREALHSTRSASRLTLAVHPDTLAHLGKALDELLAHPDLPEQSVVVPDESLKVGDIIVRQDGGEISAGLDAQLARLREELM